MNLTETVVFTLPLHGGKIGVEEHASCPIDHMATKSMLLHLGSIQPYLKNARGLENSIQLCIRD